MKRSTIFSQGDSRRTSQAPLPQLFIKLGNAESRAKTGKDLIGNTDNLVLSPVVIAMWKPIAEAIGWGKKPLGWADILALSRKEKGWDALVRKKRYRFLYHRGAVSKPRSGFPQEAFSETWHLIGNII